MGRNVLLTQHVSKLEMRKCFRKLSGLVVGDCCCHLGVKGLSKLKVHVYRRE